MRTCYGGYDRGLFAELLHLIGLIVVTGLSINYAGAVIAWFHALMPWQPEALPAVVFWVLFLTLVGVKQLLVKSLTTVVKGERLPGAIQSIGILLGATRGLWWSGVVVLALASSGVAYLQQSAEERSVLGAKLLPIARDAIVAAADTLPGAEQRNPSLIPPLQQEQPKSSKHS